MSGFRNISRIEKYIYFSVWILAVLFSLYHFSKRSFSYFQYYKDKYDDFTEGFNYISSKRDKSDFEWETINYLLEHFFSSIFSYVVVSDLIRNLCAKKKIYQLWQVCFTILYLLTRGGSVTLYLILLQPVIFFITCNFFRNAIITWSCSGISLLCITHFKRSYSEENFIKPLNLNYYDIYLLVLCLFWMNLKCTGYFLEKESSKGFLDFFSYCLYPPTLFTGPFIMYEDYLHIYQPVTLPVRQRLKKLVLNLSRCLFWFIFANVCLHYVYVNATMFQPKLVAKFDYWSLYGFGYAMGQFFHIKYLVLYGLSTSFASYENVRVPHLPRCIGRIHLYSDMWKYFDPGLYNFLLRYIYVPMCKTFHYKLIASLISFLFVYCWHGLEDYILIWTVLNYIGIVLEYTSSVLYKKYFEKEFETLIDAFWLRRIKCIMASPLLVMSAVSNFYFFAGTDIGNIFAKRIFEGGLVSNIILLFTLYCCCQVSTELQAINANKM